MVLKDMVFDMCVEAHEEAFGPAHLVVKRSWRSVEGTMLIGVLDEALMAWFNN